MQVEFEFGSGRIIFGRVMPLGLTKNPLIFSFRSWSPLQIDILNRNLVYRCVTENKIVYRSLICKENTQVEFEFASGRIILGRVMPLGLRKIQLIFSFRSLSPLQIDILNWNLVYSLLYTGQVQMWFYLNYFQQCYAPSCHLALMYLSVRQFLTSPIF